MAIAHRIPAAMKPASRVNLLAVGNLEIFVPRPGLRFIPLLARLCIISKTGTTVTNPIVRIGTNSPNFDNVCPAFTVTTTSVNAVYTIPLVASVVALDVNALSMFFRVSTAGTGTTVLMAEAYLQGIFA